MLKVVQKFLQINRYSEVKSEFKDLFLSHPNYPSLFAITDSLDLLSIENVAVRVSKEQIVDLPQNFLAYFKDELVLVEKAKNFVSINTDKGSHKVTYENFLLDWNGVVVAIEPNNVIAGENLRIEFDWLKYTLPILFLVGLSFFYNTYNVFSLVFLIISILGLFVSVLIVQEKLGFQNGIISKFCNLSSNSSCNSVLHANGVKDRKWINFSDLPLVFFGSSFIAILLQPLESSIFIGFLSLLCIPVIVSSIWIQKFEIQKWCVMCLVISFLIFTQSVIWFSSDLFTLDFAIVNVFPFLFSLIFIVPIWVIVKVVLKDIFNNESTLKGLMKFKRNYSLLNFLSKKVPHTEGFDAFRGLNFGNRNAIIKLSIIISPSCEHCNETFQDAFDLVIRFPEKIFLSVLFNVNPQNTENPYKVVVERLLMINRVTPGKTVEAISDWHIKKIGLKKWLKKWHVDSVSMLVKQEIQKQYDWCAKNNFNYTPVKIVNDRLFPNEYELHELKYFLNDFVEEIEVLEKIA